MILSHVPISQAFQQREHMGDLEHSARDTESRLIRAIETSLLELGSTRRELPGLQRLNLWIEIESLSLTVPLWLSLRYSLNCEFDCGGAPDTDRIASCSRQ